MSKVRVHNTLASKIFTIIFIIAFIVGIIFLAATVLIKDKNNNVFDLGEIDSSMEYTDKIVNSYEEFKELIDKYNVSFEATEEELKTSSFLFLFQDYNPCGESKPKTVESINIDENVNITFKVHSKCGWCKRHMVLYIIKTEILEENKNIEFKYVFPNTQTDCGTVE